jgi:hypothetical protein
MMINIQNHKKPSHDEGVMINFNSTMSDYKKVLAKAATS